MRTVSSVTMVAAALLLVIAVGAQEQRVNLALHKPYVITPPAAYSITHSGDTDQTDLTDGRVSQDDKLWFLPSAVGWRWVGVAQVRVDLGEVQAIDEVAMTFQGGASQGQFTFPDRVEAFVSDDDETYYRVGDFQFMRAGDCERFRLPRETGVPWVHTLRFENLKTRGRYVGLRLKGGQIVSDELFVFAGHHDPAQVQFAADDEALFTVKAPYVYSVREAIYVCRDFVGKTIFGATPGTRDTTNIRLYLDLPEGVRLVPAGSDGLRYTDPAVPVAQAEKTASPEGTTRYVFDTAVVAKAISGYHNSRLFGQFFLTTDWPAGRTGELRYGMQVQGGRDYEVVVPLEAVSIGPVPRSDALRSLIGPFWESQIGLAWPGFFDMCERMGLTAVGERLYRAGSEASEKYLAEARRRGFEIVASGEAMQHIYNSKYAEAHCEIAPGEYAVGWGGACPSYRGKYWQDVLNKIRTRIGHVRPDVVTWDIEFFGWRGPQHIEKCLRCTADFEKSGAQDWQEWKSQKGVEMMGAYIGAVEEKCREIGIPAPEEGVYDFVVGGWFQNFWNVTALNRTYGINSEPCTYSVLHPANLEHIGDEARQTKLQMDRGDVFPWLCPGDFGTFSAEQMRWGMLESFANGARGVYWWSHRMWDTDYLMGMAGALANVYPVQHIIAAGEPLGEIGATEGVRVRGMRLGDEMFLLVADYRISEAKVVQVSVPVETASEVVDLESGKLVGALDDHYNTLAVALSPEQRVRVYCVMPAQ